LDVVVFNEVTQEIVEDVHDRRDLNLRENYMDPMS
jgi:hypothetical protein